MEVKIMKVTPPPDSPKDDICLHLTFFDLINLIFPPVELLFFYETPPNNPHSVLVSKLKHSLSQTLKHFLPVAGHFEWPHSSPNPVIRYKHGNAVVLTVTTSDADFYHLSGKEIRESKNFQPLVARIVMSGTQVPVIAFKITLFPNKGICIGVTVHHSLFDATSTTMFMNAWASFAKFDEGRELTPIFDRKFLREQYHELESSCIETLNRNKVTSGQIWSVLGPERPDNIVRGTFVLSGSDVTKLKGLITSNDQVPYISTFAVAYGYVIICLVKVKPPQNHRVNISFAFECRHRLEHPLPKNYFGNCVGSCDAYFTREELLGKGGMALVVNFISKATRKIDNGRALEGAEEWLPNIFGSIADNKSMRVFVAGSSRFEYQSVDFGWGKPRKADIASIDGTGGVSFTRGDENKGGIEVELSLNKCEMEIFAYLFDQGLRNMKSS